VYRPKRFTGETLAIKASVPKGRTRIWTGNWTLLGHYAASSGDFLPTFRDKL